MKKLFALLAVVLAVVSCQKDAGLDVNVGGEQLVNITVALPEATRANSGAGFDLATLGTDFELRYILEIYVDGNIENRIRKELFTTDTENVVFPVRLVPKRNYRVVAWADIVPAVDNRDVEGDFDYDYYYETTEGLDAVTIIENKWNAMDEKRDAYTAYQVVNNFTANTAINLTLKRPFAKLRVVSTDIKDIEDLGYSLKDVVVEYNVDLKREFNALYGTANAASYKSHTFNFYTTTPYDDKDNKDSRTLFADYIFVKNIEEQDAVQFTMSVYAQDDLLKTTTFNTDIALRANTLTTIIGEVLTEGGNVQIEIDGELNEDQAKDYTVVSSASDLLKFINAGGEYILGNDIIVTEADAAEAQGIITRTTGEANEANEPKTTTINLNGKTITIINKSNEPLVTVPAGNTLTFTDNTNTGSIVLAEDSTESFIENEGTVILEAGEINNHEDNNVPVIDGKIVIDGATVNDNEVEESNKLDNNEKWFADVIANGGTVILSNDMSFKDIIVVTAKKPVVINGNGKTITSTAGRAINVSGATDVTIKNLNIVASGERAINVITDSKNVTIENVTATAANYTVNVAASAPNAVVAIKNSTLNGLCTVNVASAGANVTVEGSTVNCNDNNTTEGESYAALCLNKAAVGAKIIATNSTINVTEGSDSTKGRNGAEDGEVTINGSVEGVVVTKAVITYPGSDYYYGFETIQAAVDFAKSGDKISLIRDVTVDEPVVLAEGKTAVLDLNGKTLAAVNVESTYAINNLGTLTIKGGGTVNARGIYNGYVNGGENVASAKLTIENGTFNAKGTNGGACVYNYGVVEVKGGKFESNGGYGLNNQSGASMTITGGEIRGGIYNCGSLSIDGENTSVYQHLSGKHAIYNWSATAIINNGTFDSESGNELIFADGENSSVTINGGTFDKTAKSWFMAAATGKNITFVINGGTFRGYVNKPEMTVDTFRPYGDPIVVCGGNFNFNPTKWLSDDYKAIEISKDVYKVVSGDANYLGTEVRNKDGELYTGDAFASGYMENTLWFNNYIFGGEAAIKVVDMTYGAIIIENSEGSFINDAITIDNTNNSVMILENLNLTIAEGKKLIKSVNKIHQVFMANITINGELMTQETIAKYLENVEWYQVVDEI